MDIAGEVWVKKQGGSGGREVDLSGSSVNPILPLFPTQTHPWPLLRLAPAK